MTHPRISRNYQRGAMVRHPNTLVDMAFARKGVYHAGWNKIIPAAMLTRMQFHIVIQWVREKRLYAVNRLPDSLKTKCPWPIYEYNDATGRYDKSRR